MSNEAVFDSVRHSSNDNLSTVWGAHAIDWISAPLGPGDHTVSLQFWVDEDDATFTLGDRTLVVDMVPSSNVTISAASSEQPAK